MILNDELRKAFAQKIDDLIKLPAWAEPFDKLALNYAFKYIDAKYGHKVPAVLIDDIQIIVEAFVTDNYTGIIDSIAPVANDLINIPGLDEDLEGKFFAINIKAAFEFIEYYAKKQ